MYIGVYVCVCVYIYIYIYIYINFLHLPCRIPRNSVNCKGVR